MNKPANTIKPFRSRESIVGLDFKAPDGIPDDFIEHGVTQIEAFKAFARVLPRWAKANRSSATIVFKVDQASDDIMINVSFPENTSTEIILDLFQRMAQGERLSDLQLLVQEAKNWGIDPTMINAMVDEGERLASSLFPRPQG